MVARGRYFAGAAAQPPKEAGAAPLIHHCDRPGVRSGGPARFRFIAAGKWRATPRLSCALA